MEGIMDGIGAIAATYRALVYDDPQFVQYFQLRRRSRSNAWKSEPPRSRRAAIAQRDRAVGAIPGCSMDAERICCRLVRLARHSTGRPSATARR